MPHPSKGHLKLTHRIKHVIPMVSFLDFPNSESFGEILINDVVETERLRCHEARLTSMEKYARVALLLFVPFRNAKNELQLDGKYLLFGIILLYINFSNFNEVTFWTKGLEG